MDLEHSHRSRDGLRCSCQCLSPSLYGVRLNRQWTVNVDVRSDAPVECTDCHSTQASTERNDHSDASLMASRKRVASHCHHNMFWLCERSPATVLDFLGPRG